MPEMLDDRYKLYERLGEGGMAEVFRAEDLRLGREVAVKALRPQYASEKNFLDRFIDEARSMAGFSHRNVVNVYDVGKDGNRYYIVMEYVPGEDLRKMLERTGRLPVKTALEVARQMAQGIGYAHRKGLVHRDVKPGNILITPEGDVKVADFGIAKALASVGLTEPGVVWGTTAYLSPEQVRGDHATPASDVNGIGIVLYEMLAGRPPFRGEDRVAIALKHLHEEPPPLPDDVQLPRGVLQLLAKALTKEPNGRFESADEMAQSLSRYQRVGRETTARAALSGGAASLPAARIAGVAIPSRDSETPPLPSRRARPNGHPPSGRPLARRPGEEDAEQAAGELRRLRATEAAQERRNARLAQERATGGRDRTTIGLGVLALLLTAGLIPLYARVLEVLQ
jgi:serine/threonine-protein kinase